MQSADRAFPNSWGGRDCFGYTKREDIVIKMTQAIVSGLYGYKGDLNKMTEDQIVDEAAKLADSIIKKI